MVSAMPNEPPATSAKRPDGALASQRRGSRAASAPGGGIIVPVVAIGTSAGGLDAASKLLDALPADTGMAFILVQHLDPHQDNLLVDLLSDHTAMTVVEAVDGGALAADHVYIIPPGQYLSVRGGTLHVSASQPGQGVRMPFDVLIRSLAEACGAQTACLILSGTGTDGSSGLVPFKAKGGFIVAQKPEEAEHDGMPQSGIDSGLVDKIVTLAKMPGVLAEFAARVLRTADQRRDHVDDGASGLADILAYLKETTRHDFRRYKPDTLKRRIERRIGLVGLNPGDQTGYLKLLREDQSECDLLSTDFLINVTGFFRDTAVFETLETETIPSIIRQLPDHQSLRIWVAGCSTGEEAYSLAMMSQNAIEESGRNIRLQIFASDADKDAIAIAREGRYPAEIAHHVSQDRLGRYFTKENDGYKVATLLRAVVIFAVQDILSDPPFSRIDLISCRNLLIYLNPEAQANVISLFHFALRDGGVLLLGPSETVGNAEGRFQLIDKANRIYRHVARTRVARPGVPFSFARTLPLLASSSSASTTPPMVTFADVFNRALLANHAPAAVLINCDRQWLYSSGPIERYLRIAPGYATLDILAMTTPALRTKLSLAIDRACETRSRVDGGRTRLTHDGSTIWFRIDVEWLSDQDENLLLVCFVEDSEGQAPRSRRRGDGARIADLERELEATQAELQTAIQNQEKSSREQKAINQQALAANEEYQSTNEKLLTSKEELQSLNEELTALNSQLQETLERQRMTSDDLQNVLYSTKVGTLFLDGELRIRFYTPAIKTLFNVIPTDIGRGVADLNPVLSDPSLLSDARKVLADEKPVESEISAPNERWFVRRIFPYRAHDGRVEGVVITIADITERRLVARELEAAKLVAERANRAKSRFLAAASHDLRQPLQSLTLLQALLAQTGRGDTQKKLLARLDQTLGVMSGMLNALLDINQIEAGVVEAKPQIFPVSDVLDRLRDEFTEMAHSKGLKLRIRTSSAIIESDPRLLEQMIRNLLGNALKYTERGTILLGCRRRGDQLRIEVWDTGIGIEAEDIDPIFDEYNRIATGADGRSQGLGLGLSIVQRIGELLGHDVDVRSTPGKGSVFAITVQCPAIPSASRPKPPEPLGEDGAHLPHRHEILIVDDDDDVLELLGEWLTTNGHSVTTAQDGASAVQLIRAGAVWPDILLSDYNLPNGMTGLELLASLRDALHYHLPAIVLTGDISSEVLTTIAAQDSLLINKPVDPHELMHAIRQVARSDRPRSREAAPRDASPTSSTIYVIDDDESLRGTIADVLEGDGRKVRVFPSAETFLQTYTPWTGGCLLVDAYLPGMDGVPLLKRLRGQGDDIPAILITGASDVGLAVEAMRAGASDFIGKPVNRDDLLASVRLALDQSRDLQGLNAVREVAASNIAALTPRQRQVLDLVLAGSKSKNIAAELGISQRTVENHRASVMRKMGAKSLPELARQALAAEKKTS